MDIMVMDENRGRTDFADSRSKLGSTIQINSIAIDFSSSMEAIESPVHDHFSIRGFVSGMRKKDWKTCFPFASDVESTGNLPPLFVPEFRWWQCSSCIPNAEMNRSTEEMVVATKGDADTNSCMDVGGKDMACVADDGDNTSSGTDGTFSILPYKRKPKLRSLADILVEGRKQTSSDSRTRSASSCGIVQVAFTGMGAILVPQLEVVPSGVAKTIPSHERKRKVALSEDREPIAAICQKAAAAKRPKGLLLDGEKKSTRVEIFDPESKRGASMRADLPRTQLIKPKKAKAIDTSKKKRKIHRDDEIAKMREYLKLNDVSSANLQEQAIPVGPCFSGSRSGQPTERAFELSVAKSSKVGDDFSFLRPLKESISGNCSIRGKGTLDRSLDTFMDTDHGSLREHGFIPDLNMEFPEKTAMAEDQQFTKKSLPLHKTMVHKNENVREGKRLMRTSEPKNKNNNVELGASDDIPMEIVELFARNQHERELGNSRRHFLETNNSTRAYSAINKDDYPCKIKFPLPSRKNGSTGANGVMGVSQLDTSRPEENQFRLFCSSTPSQLRKPEYPTSTSKMVGPRSSTGAEFLCSSARKNVPFCLSIPQNHSIQLSGMSAYPFLDQCHKGKKAVSGSIYTSVTALGPYTNDTIPAMQLLSLMDQGGKSGSSFQVGTKASLDKPFSPCKHHPRLNGKENHNFHHKSLFKHNSNSKDFPWLNYGVNYSGESSERASSKLRVQVPREVRNLKTNPVYQSNNLEKLHARSDEALGNCTLNKNPADFSIPEVGNIFTLTAKELKLSRRNAVKENSQTWNLDGRKRERMAQ